MKKKLTLLCFFAIFILATSCKKETTSTEEKVPNGIEATSIPTPEEIKVINEKVVPADGKYPVMTFEEKEYDFGTIKQGDKVDHTFVFKNTGEADLIITDAKASCGCTIPEYPKNTPIKPGEAGKMKVTFNSAGKSGQTMKTITVSANTENGNELLKIKTTIKVPTKGA